MSGGSDGFVDFDSIPLQLHSSDDERQTRSHPQRRGNRVSGSQRRPRSQGHSSRNPREQLSGQREDQDPSSLHGVRSSHSQNQQLHQSERWHPGRQKHYDHHDRREQVDSTRPRSRSRLSSQFGDQRDSGPQSFRQAPTEEDFFGEEEDLEEQFISSARRRASMDGFGAAPPQRSSGALLPSLFVEPVRRGSRRSICKTCRQELAVGELRLGFTVDVPGPQQPSWIHASCARRANLSTCMQLVALSPVIPESERQEVLEMLGRMRPRTERTPVRAWNYLPASVGQWEIQVIQEHSTASSSRQPTSTELESQQQEQLISRILAAIPSDQLSRDIGAADPCAICHQEMRAGEMVCRLPCKHVYHVGCIDTWLRIRTTCPLDNLCIKSMLKPEGVINIPD
eukprot:TRINITY_DN27091_c0_g1_i1.p1 TRINITY_DN27091_c0_g1~~TRINITY_DN27091_c0_g1_i1.p1  ORF type:complete len:397 (+),score=47.22 TRINITY_DN27091_c0_g1_i1:193-1383(+)